MTTISVQFSDVSETSIVSYFCGPQDPSAFANQGTVEADDARWGTYLSSVPEMFRSGLPGFNS